jgi:hypothetical protein
MDVKRSLSVIAALVALGVAGPTAVSAADDDDATAVTATAPANHEGESAADEQRSGEDGDVENTDLATEVEQADGADDKDGVNEESEVGDGVDGQVDDDADDDADND